MDKPQRVTEVSEAVKGVDGIEQIKDQRELVDKIMSITKTIKYVSAVVFVILIGAIISIVLLYFLYRVAYLKVPSEVVIIKLVDPSYIFNSMSWEFILIGMLIGGIGSILVMRKFIVV